MPLVCPLCEMWTATAAGCSHCGAEGVVPTGIAVVVTGACGSGKTALAERLHALLPDCVVIDTDNLLDLSRHGLGVQRNALLQVAYTVIQGGRTPVLCGVLLPEHLDECPARDHLDTIAFLNLDCSDEERTRRLQSRPQWRQSSKAEFIADHIAFAKHLRERKDLATYDTTDVEIHDSARVVADWVRKTISQSAPATVPRLAKPTVHLLCGHVGSGKTTLARSLEVECRAVRFTLDEWMLNLYDLTPYDPSYGEMAARCREVIWSSAEAALRVGVDVVLDWSQWNRERRAEWSRRAHRAGANVLVHHLTTPLDTAVERVRMRNSEPPPGAHVIDVDQMRQFAEGFFEPPDRSEGLDIVCHP